jgi:hypothetical protein
MRVCRKCDGRQRAALSRIAQLSSGRVVVPEDLVEDAP